MTRKEVDGSAGHRTPLVVAPSCNIQTNLGEEEEEEEEVELVVWERKGGD